MGGEESYRTRANLFGLAITVPFGVLLGPDPFNWPVFLFALAVVDQVIVVHRQGRAAPLAAWLISSAVASIATDGVFRSLRVLFAPWLDS